MGGDGVRVWLGPDRRALWTIARGSDFIPNAPVDIPRAGLRTTAILKIFSENGRTYCRRGFAFEFQSLCTYTRRPQGAGNSGLGMPS